MDLRQVDVRVPHVIKEVECALQLAILENKAKRNYVNDETYEISVVPFMNGQGRSMTLDEFAELDEVCSPLRFDAIRRMEMDDSSSSEKEFFDEYVVAGGFPSDLYATQQKGYEFKNSAKNKPFKDCDIFVEAGVLSVEDLQKHLPTVELKTERVRGRKYADVFDILDFVYFEYKGIQFEIISVVSLLRVEVFDFRFRNFFYKKNNVYGTVGAIKDVESKELNIQSPHTPETSLVRGIYFEEKYGYCLTDHSKQWLKWELANQRTDVKELDKVIEERTESEEEQRWYKQKIAAIIGEERETANGLGRIYEVLPRETVEFPFDSAVEKIYRSDFFREDEVALMADYQPMSMQNQVFDFDDFKGEVAFSALKRMDERISNQIFEESLTALVDEYAVPKDYDVLRRFAEKSPEEKMMCLNNPKLDEAKTFMEWFISGLNFDPIHGTFAKGEAEKEFVETMMKKEAVLRMDSRQCPMEEVLAGETVGFRLESPYNKEWAYYNFRKTERNVFVLVHLHSRYPLLKEKSSIQQVLRKLKVETDGLFDFGRQGEKVKTPSGRFPWLANLEKREKGYVLNNAFSEDEEEPKGREKIV